MKKALVFLLAVIMLLAIPVEAFAEAPDFAAMTDEELHEFINLARNELKKRELNAEADMVLIDQDGVTFYLTGDYRVYGSDTVFVEFQAIAINDSDKQLSIQFDSATLNGWDVYGGGTGSISAHSKKKCDISFSLSDADISTFEEIEEITMKLYLYDSDAWTRLSNVEPITLHFN